MKQAWMLPILLLSLVLSGCGKAGKNGDAFEGTVNDYDGVTITVVEGSAHPGTVTVEILNTTDADIQTGTPADAKVQREEGGIWYDLQDAHDEHAYTAEAYECTKDTPLEQTYFWANCYGSLPKGHYRVVKGMLEHHEPGDNDYFNLAAEFTLE